jgi:hypothetical protein
MQTMMNFITNQLAKYFGPKFANQYVSTFVAWLAGIMGTTLAGYGINGADSYIQQVASGLGGILILGINFYFTTSHDVAQAKPEKPELTKGK